MSIANYAVMPYVFQRENSALLICETVKYKLFALVEAHRYLFGRLTEHLQAQIQKLSGKLFQLTTSPQIS